MEITKLGKIGNYDIIVMSYTDYLYFFGMYGKSRLQAFIFEVHKGVATPPPLVSCVTKKKKPELDKGK